MHFDIRWGVPVRRTNYVYNAHFAFRDNYSPIIFDGVE